eukprot:SAG11_NODE_303_length_11000_cov_7.979635_1_plen_330_part_00
MATAAAEQLEQEGYVVFPQVYSPGLVDELRQAVDGTALQSKSAREAFEANPFQGIYSLSDIADPAIPRLLAWDPARDALRKAGVNNPRFTSGYSLSKPPGGPALYWHRDWHFWELEEESALARGTQLFLMLYLVDTSPTNGCLRVLPRSHLGRVPLDDHIAVESRNAHGGRTSWGADLARDPSLAEDVQNLVAGWPGAVDVPVRAGDLVVGDSRLFHAANRNQSNERRTCLTMWYVDWDQCGATLRATYADRNHAGSGTGVRGRGRRENPCGIPCETEAEAALLRPLEPTYEGEAKPVVPSRLLGEWGRVHAVPASGVRHSGGATVSKL